MKKKIFIFVFLSVFSLMIFKFNFVSSTANALGDDKVVNNNIYYSEGNKIVIDDKTTIPQQKKENWSEVLQYLENENKNKTEKFNETTISSLNLTLYANLSPETYVINYNLDGGTNNSENPVSYTIETETIILQEPTKDGYNFLGWYNSEKTKITQIEKGSYGDIDLYAEWEKQKFTVIVYSFFDDDFAEFQIEYGSDIPSLSPKEVEGYNFEGYFDEYGIKYEGKLDNNSKFNFDEKVNYNLQIYEKYEKKLYNLTFINYENADFSKKIEFGEKIILSEPEERKGYIFVDWYLENDFKTLFKDVYTTMPAQDLTAYAKWSDKETIKINTTIQRYQSSGGNVGFKIETEINDIKIEYRPSGNSEAEWTQDSPSDLGVYDVKITREEDSKYLAVNTIIERGLIIEMTYTNLSYLIAFLYIFTIFEIIISLVMRIMIKKKLSSTFVIVGAISISTSQFVNLIISGLMCLAGFVYMIYQIVKLTQSVNNENFAPSKEDSRARFKDDLRFQNDSKNRELDFETKTKTDESFGDKYSESDIERLLKEDTFTQKIKESRGDFAENNQEINSNSDLSYIEEDEIINTENETDISIDEDENQTNENIMPEIHYEIERQRNDEKILKENNEENFNTEQVITENLDNKNILKDNNQIDNDWN